MHGSIKWVRVEEGNWFVQEDDYSEEKVVENLNSMISTLLTENIRVTK